jgi:hypothetical protein
MKEMDLTTENFLLSFGLEKKLLKLIELCKVKKKANNDVMIPDSAQKPSITGEFKDQVKSRLLSELNKRSLIRENIEIQLSSDKDTLYAHCMFCTTKVSVIDKQRNSYRSNNFITHVRKHFGKQLQESDFEKSLEESVESNTSQSEMEIDDQVLTSSRKRSASPTNEVRKTKQRLDKPQTAMETDQGDSGLPLRDQSSNMKEPEPIKKSKKPQKKEFVHKRRALRPSVKNSNKK